MSWQGHKCDLVYYDPYPNSRLEEFVKEYSQLLESRGEAPVTVQRLESVEAVLKASDVRAPPPPPSPPSYHCTPSLPRPISLPPPLHYPHLACALFQL